MIRRNNFYVSILSPVTVAVLPVQRQAARFVSLLVVEGCTPSPAHQSEHVLHPQQLSHHTRLSHPGIEVKQVRDYQLCFGCAFSRVDEFCKVIVSHPCRDACQVMNDANAKP